MQLVSSKMSAQMSSLVLFISPCPWLTLVVRWSFEKSSSLLCSCGKHMFRIFSSCHSTSTNSGRKNSRAVDEHCEWIVMSRHFICIHASYIYIRIHIRHMYQYASTFVLSQRIVRIQVRVTEAEMESRSAWQSCVWLKTSQDISRRFTFLCLSLPVLGPFPNPKVTVVGSWVIVTMSEKRLRMRCSISSSRETSVQH